MKRGVFARDLWPAIPCRWEFWTDLCSRILKNIMDRHWIPRCFRIRLDDWYGKINVFVDVHKNISYSWFLQKYEQNFPRISFGMIILIVIHNYFNCFLLFYSYFFLLIDQYPLRFLIKSKVKWKWIKIIYWKRCKGYRLKFRYLSNSLYRRCFYSFLENDSQTSHSYSFH